MATEIHVVFANLGYEGHDLYDEDNRAFFDRDNAEQYAREINAKSSIHYQVTTISVGDDDV